MFLALRGCLETSKFPLDLQLGNITPVFKKCKRSHKKNHLSTKYTENMRKYVRTGIPAYFGNYLFRANGLWYTIRYFILMKELKGSSKHVSTNRNRKLTYASSSLSQMSYTFLTHKSK